MCLVAEKAEAAGALSIWCLVACLCTHRTPVDFSPPARILASGTPLLSVTPLSGEGITSPVRARDPVYTAARDLAVFLTVVGGSAAGQF